jgi:hypothetical protein
MILSRTGYKNNPQNISSSKKKKISLSILVCKKMRGQIKSSQNAFGYGGLLLSKLKVKKSSG